MPRTLGHRPEADVLVDSERLRVYPVIGLVDFSMMDDIDRSLQVPAGIEPSIAEEAELPRAA
jgi:hypothetical protein